MMRFNKALFAVSIALSISQVSVFAGSGISITNGPDMKINRMGHYPAIISDGRVILFGGHGTNFVSLNTSEIYNPATDSFSIFTMKDTRDAPAIARLNDGRYLLAGGAANLGVAPGNKTAEIFDPSNNSFSAVTGTLTYGRMTSCAATLNDSLVLIVGGWYNISGPKIPEVFNVHTQTFSVADTLTTARAWPLVVPIANSQALVFGGIQAYGSAIHEQVELYDAATNQFSVLSNSLFGTADSGWSSGSYSGYNRTMDQQRMKNGNYLLSATKGSSYSLFTVDPATKAIQRVSTTPAKFYDSTLSIYPPLVDTLHNRAYILGISWVASISRYTICCYIVEMSNWSVRIPNTQDTLPASYFLSGIGLSVLQNGSILMSGGHSVTGGTTNFNPIKSSKILIPDTSMLVTSLGKPVSREVVNSSKFEVSYNSGYIKIRGNRSGSISLRISDISGRTICNFGKMTVNENSERKIPKMLPKGTYICSIDGTTERLINTIVVW